MDLQHVHRLQAQAQSQRTVRREEWEVGTIIFVFPSTGLCAAPAKQSVLLDCCGQHAGSLRSQTGELQLKELLVI